MIRWLLIIALLLLSGVDEANCTSLPSDSQIDPELLRVDDKEYLGVKVTEGSVFIDSQGKEFTWKDLGDKPVILVLSYYTCDGFCPAFNTELRSVLERVQNLSRVKIGDDFAVLTLSFDGNDDPESAGMFREKLALPDELEKDWKVAVFKERDRIKSFTNKIGYKFFWSPPDRMFFHPNAFYFITPERRVSRILHNSLTDASDMELAILDAKFSRMKPTEIVNFAVSLCYSYNYKEGKYGLNYPLFIAFGSLFGGITAFAVAANVSRKKAEKLKISRGKGEKL